MAVHDSKRPQRWRQGGEQCQCHAASKHDARVMATRVQLVTTQFVADGHAVDAGGHAGDGHAVVYKAGLKQGALGCRPGAVPKAVTT
jgi:hypothetical protein